MKATAIGFSQYGDIDMFETKEIDVHVNALNNVLVKVERIGLKPVDAFIRSGNMSGGKPLTRFQVLGGEVQGEIVAFDAPVSGLAVGDKVIVRPGQGGYATYVSTNAKNVFKIPADMSLDFAASFSATTSTAYWALHGHFYDIQPGDTVAVVGASGSVGSYIVQLAQSFDVNIIGVASGKNKDFILSLGADVFVDYNDEEAVAKYAKTADVVFDASLFNAGEDVALALAKEHATYIGMTTLPSEAKRPDVARVFLSRTKEMTNDVAMPALFDFYETNGLQDHIAYKLPFTLDGVKEAHTLLASSRKSGKILLVV
jgi:NADPH:quinone reductase